MGKMNAPSLNLSSAPCSSPAPITSPAPRSLPWPRFCSQRAPLAPRTCHARGRSYVSAFSMAAETPRTVPRAFQREAIAVHTRHTAIRSSGDPMQTRRPNSTVCSQPVHFSGGRTTDLAVTDARSETESISNRLASILTKTFALKHSLDSRDNEWSQRLYNQRPLRILDLCTGTGCIALLVHSLLSPHIPELQIKGVDISPTATSLANENLKHNIKSRNLQQSAKEQISFHHGDIFSLDSCLTLGGRANWDVVISNPPYISPQAFNRTTSRSVRNYEPKLALVPPHRSREDTVGESCTDAAIGDAFYPRLLHIAQQVRAKIILMEVADLEQAKRVVKLALSNESWDGCAIWKDWPGAAKAMIEVDGGHIEILGEGNGRAVLAWNNGCGRIVPETSGCCH